MKTTFYPAVNDQFGSIAPVRFGIAVLTPDDYDVNKQYPCQLFIHGMGNLGAGSKGELENLWLGYAYGPGGSRVNPAVPQDYLTSIDKYGIVTVFVNYKDFFQPDHFKYVYDLVRKNFTVSGKWCLEGFSWGAGAIMKIIGSVYAQYVAVVCPCAPTFESDINWSYTVIVAAWLFVNDGDDNGPTAMSVTQKLIATMNTFRPGPAAVYTAFHQTGHGGTNQMLTLAPPQAPGGKGLTNASENIYTYFLDVISNGIRQPKNDGSIYVPPTPSGMVAAGTITQVGDIFKLDASASTGYMWIGWRIDKAPIGINPYTFIKSGGWKTSDTGKVLPGDYEITLVLTGADNSIVLKTFTLNVQGVIPLPASPSFFNSVTDMLVYSDGSNETAYGTIDFIKKKVMVTTKSGTIYNY